NGIITSSATASQAGTTIGIADSADGTGVNPTANSIELKFTKMGDANLDGAVNLSDLLALTRNFGKPASWDTGDFNSDGTTNLADFLTLTRNFGQSLATASIASGYASAPAATLSDPIARRRVSGR
ncbi:MAG TPA: dockerin type I domain-containing protein, partial [Tepidisphaeraceae bacterium]|nr:dockerin type I domain-containing protein [Tepidisphaeraceae bacterium]